MKKKWPYLVLIGITLLPALVFAQQNRSFYFFSPRYLRTCFRHEIGFTFFSEHYRSAAMDTIYDVNYTQAYPSPVYMRVFTIMSMSYEPQFRLVEYRSSQSLSLDLPLNVGLSAVDLRNRSGKKFDPSPVTESEVQQGVFYHERDGELGVGHAELGALLAYNLGQGATQENVSPVGLSLAVGYNYTYAPLSMNSIYDFKRSDYARYLHWGQWVGRVGLIVHRVMFSYTIGVNSRWYEYQDWASNLNKHVLVGSYNKFAVSIRLGKV